ncbi:hypothetical protein LINPERPRIM_LOCUS10941, partial [Linum perenne]
LHYGLQFISLAQVFYDDVKTFVVEAAFGGRQVQEEVSTQLLNVNNLREILLSCLDSLTSKGLSRLVMFLTKGLTKSEKTRKKMTKEIKKSIPGFLRDLHSNHEKTCFTELFQQHAAAIEMLGRLKDLPTEALLAMNRKLRGIPAALPDLQKKKNGRSRDELIYMVRSASQEMLSKLGASGRNNLQEPLAKALAVAGLSLKLEGCHCYFLTEFVKTSPEIELLQNEIIKAIWLLKKKVSVLELEGLQNLLDSSASVSKRSLRTSMKKLFTEYLFECNDLDSIPQNMRTALTIINKRCQLSPDNYSLEHVIDDNIECILRVSSGIKQLVWDSIPNHGFDENFADAYMEEASESEDDDNVDISPRQLEIPGPSSMYSENDEESVAECMPLECESDMTTNECCSSPFQTQEAGNHTGLDDHILCKNLYLDIQEASDETSMVACNLIDHLLERMARVDLNQNDNSYLRGDCGSQQDPGIEAIADVSVSLPPLSLLIVSCSI